ncbi:G protein pathway suppressor 2-like [Acropora muricata]|uniref:G protein pathway suppressor 2-like n=1 Tax=Acropora muricata TaxID=159855 RepID=UPI0034E54382
MPVLIERSRPTKNQQRAVYAYIRRQREKGKQALAESKAKEEEEKARKREEQKKKETVEDVKKEIAELEIKLEQLKQKKHDLFSQLKKALNHEDEARRQQEHQAMKTAATGSHVSNSRSMQILSTAQGSMTAMGHTQLPLVDGGPVTGVVKRQGSPPPPPTPHPLSGYIQAQISHLQPALHLSFSPQATQGHQAVQERYPGYQQNQGQTHTAVVTGTQLEGHLSGKQQAPSGMLSEPPPLFARQAGPHQGGLPQQENQQGFSAHQLQQQQPHQQQFAYHVKQQQTSYQQHVQHGNQKQALLPTPSPQTQQRSGSAQHNQGAQSGYSVALPSDQVHPQPYHGSNVHPTQQSYQVHSHPQGYQGKQTLPYQLHQMPSGGQHPYHPQPQQQLPLPTQYPVSQGHPAPQALQGPQEQLPRQQVVASHQYHQQQGASQGEGRQSQYDGTHSNQQARVPHHQQQQQHQKQEQRPSASLGYTQSHGPYYAQGTQSTKRSNHKYAPYPYSGSKGHHQGSAGKKYSGKYQSSSEGSSSSGSHSGPSGSSRHHHHQSRNNHKGASASHNSSSQQKSSRYYQ